MNKYVALMISAWIMGASSAANSIDYIEQYGKVEFKASSYFENPAYSEQNDKFGEVQIEPSLFIEQGSTHTFIQPRLSLNLHMKIQMIQIYLFYWMMKSVLYA